MGAAAINRPLRFPAVMDISGEVHEDFSFQTRDGLTLRGWLWRPVETPRGLVVFLHGFNSTRMDGALAARRLVQRGWTVLAYDHRAHGASDGKLCTYGFREKEDVWSAIDAAGVPGPVVLIGHSMGAAMALQAGSDPRVKAVVAIAPFSDLEEIIRDVATPLLAKSVPSAIAEAEQQAGFQVREVSPRRSAAALAIPVLVLHGTADGLIHIKHSERIAAAAPAVRFIRIFGGMHHDVLWRDDVWEPILDFVDEALAPRPEMAKSQG
jgi:alpha-beta hydrolase superfamily lysophospholipase